MPFTPGDQGHVAEHNLVKSQLNGALDDLAGRLSDTTLAANYATVLTEAQIAALPPGTTLAAALVVDADGYLIGIVGGVTS